LKLWWAGYTVPQIAARLHLNEKTVRNRLSTLRQIYPEEIVPTANQLRKMGLR
jgi:DNA-directed RNA polymerase specialized sigma24 family protein